jgi:hypothetical protein
MAAPYRHAYLKNITNERLPKFGSSGRRNSALGLVVEPCGPAWSTSPNVMIGVAEKSVRRMIAACAAAKRDMFMA